MRLFAAAPLLLAAGCITPSIVAAGGSRTLDVGEFPPGTEAVALEAAPGERLRGVFVPSDPGAPVACLLLGSSASVTDFAGDSHGLLWDLRDLGFATLCVDYRGVGPSGGRRQPRHLPADAAAAYREAVRRAGGEERVLLRGVSIGTLAAASLLDAGARPGATTLVAPVRAETVATNYMRWVWPDLAASFVSPFVRRPLEVDLLSAIAKAPPSTIVFVGEGDELLPAAEVGLLAEAARRSGIPMVSLEDSGHLATALAGYSVRPEEAELLCVRFPDAPDVKGRVRAALAAAGPGAAPAPGDEAWSKLERTCAQFRIDPPALALALALEPGIDAGDPAVRYWLRSVAIGGAPELPLEAWRALVDLDDPNGALDPRELAHWASLARSLPRLEGPDRPERIARRAADPRFAERATWYTPLRVDRGRFPGVSAFQSVRLDGPLPLGAPARLSLPPEEARRQLVRIALKAARIPDRLRDGALEVYAEGRWRPLAAGG